LYTRRRMMDSTASGRLLKQSIVFGEQEAAGWCF
jgi:hypothetical protein